MEIAINYGAVLGAAAGVMVVGFLWYGPVFGKLWRGMMGYTAESMRAMRMTPLRATVGGFAGALLMSYVLAHGIVFGDAYLGTEGIAGGLIGAFWYWLGFVVPVTLGIVWWEDKPWNLWMLNAGYYLVSMLLMGAILGLWG